MTVDDSSSVSMRLIKFRSWYQKLDDESYIRNIDPCLDALENPNTYLITEAFILNDASYKLLTETGQKIELKTPEFGGFLKFEPSANYKVSTDGSLKVSYPVVLAVRRAVRIGSGFQVLATPGSDDASVADDLLDKWYVDAME